MTRAELFAYTTIDTAKVVVLLMTRLEPGTIRCFAAMSIVVHDACTKFGYRCPALATVALLNGAADSPWLTTS
jgi:hypothetical protein